MWSYEALLKYISDTPSSDLLHMEFKRWKDHCLLIPPKMGQSPAEATKIGILRTSPIFLFYCRLLVRLQSHSVSAKEVPIH